MVEHIVGYLEGGTFVVGHACAEEVLFQENREKIACMLVALEAVGSAQSHQCFVDNRVGGNERGVGVVYLVGIGDDSRITGNGVVVFVGQGVGEHLLRGDSRAGFGQLVGSVPICARDHAEGDKS